MPREVAPAGCRAMVSQGPANGLVNSHRLLRWAAALLGCCRLHPACPPLPACASWQMGMAAASCRTCCCFALGVPRCGQVSSCELVSGLHLTALSQLVRRNVPYVCSLRVDSQEVAQKSVLTYERDAGATTEVIWVEFTQVEQVLCLICNRYVTCAQHMLMTCSSLKSACSIATSEKGTSHTCSSGIMA